MVNGKRLIITTILGLIAGLISWWGMAGLPAPEAAMVVLSRTVLGFAIGLSAWRINWAIHGIVLGCIFSLPLAFGAAWTGTAAGFWTWLFAGIGIGFLIELLTTPIFHARRQMVHQPSM